MVPIADLRRVAFEIRNGSQIFWTLAKIESNCACTVGRMSPERIPPGETALLAVDYRAPSRASNDRRQVSVQFLEPDAPRVELLVLATVRPKVAVVPETFSVGDVSQDAPAKATLRIENWTSSRWSGVDLEFDDPCVRVKHISPYFPAGKPSPSQCWLADVELHVDESSFGPLTISGAVRGPDGLVVRDAVRITATAVAPWRCVPSQVFFGSVQPTALATKEIVLRLSSGVRDLALEEIDVEIEEPEWLAAELSRESAGVVRVRVDLQAALLNPGLIRSAIRLSAPSRDLPELTLPVRAIISR